jgi:hypothetical protein
MIPVFAIWGGMSLFQKIKLILIGAGILFLVGSVFYVKHVFNDRARLKIEIARLDRELQIANQTIASLKNANSTLTRQVAVQEDIYRKATEELLRLSRKPPKVIEKPKIIEKPIPIQSEECQRMGVMIDEYVKICCGNR